MTEQTEWVKKKKRVNKINGWKNCTVGGLYLGAELG